MKAATSQFALSGLAALLLLSIVGVIVLSRLGNSEAIRDARTVTRVVGNGVIEPNLTDALVAGDRAALARMDEIVRDRVLADPVVRVKIWTADGRIVYSDEPRLIGFSYSLGDEELEALEAGGVAAEKVSQFTDPENRYENGFGDLLEVYLPLKTPGGQILLFETYQRFGSVASGGRRVWLAFAPAALAALVLLWLVQVPLAWSMARRLEAGRQEREALLRRAIEASDTERRRIASDLHDSVVQDMAGISYSLSAAADLATDAPNGLAGILSKAAADTRHCVRRVRTLLLQIYPPNLHSVGLEAAMADLLAPLAARGIEAHAEIPERLSLDREVEALLFRAAQEGIRNVLAHSEASTVEVRVTAENGRVTLVVADDGRGFSPHEAERRLTEGHLGLRLLGELAADASGKLDVQSEEGHGTRLTLEVPAT